LKQADKKIAKMSKINPNFYEDFIPVKKEETQPVIYHFEDGRAPIDQKYLDNHF
jgi:hypothetical protein